MSAIIAIDLGGTRCRIGLADVADPTAVRLIEDVAAPQSREAFVGLLRQTLAAHGATRLGLGIPGLARGTTCLWVPNLPFLDGLDLSEALPGISVGLGNDAQLSLLAEVRAGAATGVDDALLLAIGTGIGSAVLAGGTIIAGNGGGACSYGWATADLSDAGEDTSGWLERMAAGRALDRIAEDIGLDGGHALIGAARTGNTGAANALAAPAEALGTAIAGAVALLDPAVVIIAGGVADAFDVMAPIMSKTIDRRLPPHLRGITIRPAAHGKRAGLVGAAFAGAAGADWRKAP